MTLAPWLKQHLQAQGHMDVNGVTRAARARRCHRCRQYLLAGYDDDVCALSVYVDPTPLSALGEAAALILGRRTYALRNRGARLELAHRDSFQIRGSPAGKPTNLFDVVADHECSTGPLPFIRSAHERFTPPALDPDAPPPF